MDAEAALREMSGNYWAEFTTVAVAHALAVASPGPDFAIVLKQSLAHGRRTAVWTSIGIGCGLSFHISYSMLGLGLLLANSPAALTVVKYLGAAYLAFIGGQALRSKARTADLNLATDASAIPGNRAAWTTGFLVNLLNPKAALFFIALFPVAISSGTPPIFLAGYGLWMMATTIGWFSFVSFVFTRPEVRRRFLRHGHWIDRALGVVFIGFAIGLALTSLA